MCFAARWGNQNTAWNFHKHLRRVLNVAISMDYIIKNPYEKYKVKLEETHRQFLTLEELERIELKPIEIRRLDAVRALFPIVLFQFTFSYFLKYFCNNASNSSFLMGFEI